MIDIDKLIMVMILICIDVYVLLFFRFVAWLALCTN